MPTLESKEKLWTVEKSEASNTCRPTRIVDAAPKLNWSVIKVCVVANNPDTLTLTLPLPPTIMKFFLRAANPSASHEQRQPESMTLLFALNDMLVKSESADALAKPRLILACAWVGLTDWSEGPSKPSVRTALAIVPGDDCVVNTRVPAVGTI